MNKMNKKAQVFDLARKTIFWTIAGIALTAVLLAFAITVANYKSKLVHVPPQLHTELIALRFTNVEECFTFQDLNTGKVVPGVIDLQKFNDEQFLKCYPLDPQTGHEDYNFRLHLLDQDMQIKTKDYANRDIFSFNKEVLVNKNGRLVKDIMIINVQDLEIRR